MRLSIKQFHPRKRMIIESKVWALDYLTRRGPNPILILFLTPADRTTRKTQQEKEIQKTLLEAAG